MCIRDSRKPPFCTPPRQSEPERPNSQTRPVQSSRPPATCEEPSKRATQIRNVGCFADMWLRPEISVG
eukprot:3652787-Alexandrium_andersonii.AAC.1